MPNSDPSALLAHSPNQISCKLDQDLVILDTHSGSYFQINSVGAAIWEKIAKAKSTETIIKELQIEYDKAPGTIEAEALDFIDTLLQKSLIHQRTN